MNKKYWNLRNRPHTKRKLEILSKYILPWGKILFSYATKNNIEDYKTAYFIDCFAGRGKYHEGDSENCKDGSPIIGIKAAFEFKKTFQSKVNLKCIFVEINKKNKKDLESFCSPFKNIDFCIKNTNFNNEIDNILKEVKNHPTLFFIDPGDIKSLNKNTLQKIISRKGPNDILINYICGVKRVLGKAKKTILKGDKEQTKKLILSVANRNGLDNLLENLDECEKNIFSDWVDKILNGTNLKYRVTYTMEYPNKKNEAVYYLLFASRNETAKKIMDDIFDNISREDYNGQRTLFKTRQL